MSQPTTPKSYNLLIDIPSTPSISTTTTNTYNNNDNRKSLLSPSLLNLSSNLNDYTTLSITDMNIYNNNMYNNVVDITNIKTQNKIKSMKLLQSSILDDIKNNIDINNNTNTLNKLSQLMNTIETIAVVPGPNGKDIIADWAYNDVKKLLSMFKLDNNISNISKSISSKPSTPKNITPRNILTPKNSNTKSNNNINNKSLSNNKKDLQIENLEYLYKNSKLDDLIINKNNKTFKQNNSEYKLNLSSSLTSTLILPKYMESSLLDKCSLAPTPRVNTPNMIPFESDAEYQEPYNFVPLIDIDNKPKYSLADVKSLVNQGAVMLPPPNPIREKKKLDLRSSLSHRDSLNISSLPFRPSSATVKNSLTGSMKKVSRDIKLNSKPVQQKNMDNYRNSSLYKVQYFPHTEGALYCQNEFHEVLNDGTIVHVSYLPVDGAFHKKNQQIAEKNPMSNSELQRLLELSESRFKALLTELQASHQREAIGTSQISLLEDALLQEKLRKDTKVENSLVSITEMAKLREDLLLITNERDSLKSKMNEFSINAENDAKQIAELRASLADMKSKYDLVLGNNSSLHEEFKKFRDANSKKKFDFLYTNQNLTDTMRDLLNSNQELQTLFQGEREKNLELIRRLEAVPQPLSSFQKLKIMVHEALFRFFRDKLRNERVNRDKLLAELSKSKNDLKVIKENKEREIGILIGRLSSEEANKEKLEAKVKELEAKLDSFSQLLAQIERFKRDLSDELTMHNATRVKLSNSEEHIKKLILEVSGLKIMLQTMKRDSGLMEETIKAQKSEIETLRLRLDAAVRQLAELKKQLISADSMQDVMTLEKKTDKVDDNREEKSPYMLHFILLMREGFEGDYLNAKSTPEILTHLFEHADSAESIIFTDKVNKIGRFNENARNMILTKKNLYLIDQPTKFLSRCLAITNIEFITIGRSHGQIIALHMKKDHDILLMFDKRSELLFHIIKSYYLLTHHKLQYKYADRIYVRDINRMQREIEIFEPQKFRTTSSSIIT